MIPALQKNTGLETKFLVSSREPIFCQSHAERHTSAFVHIAHANNIELNFTIIDDPLTNNNPDAILMVTTQNWIQLAEDKNGVYNAQSIGVW